MATAETARHLSATVLLGKGLTPGKLRGLQRISNPNGTLTMLALDQNSSMIDMAAKALKAKGQDREPTYEEVVEAKLDMMRNMASAASGVLIDGYYGAWSAIASGAIPPSKGLLVRVERSGGPKNKVGAPMGAIEPGWSVEKIKLMGADAVKLLAPFEPTEPISCEHQFQLIEHVYNECRKHDILLLLETVAFPIGKEKKTDPSFLARKAETVIESARQVSRFCDVYKAEFPGTMGHESDAQLHDNLLALDAASERPWVLLSAGVDYADYFKQIQMAMGAGASGILGGRAFWKEYFLQEEGEARSKFAATTGLKRVADADVLVKEKGSPWFSRYGLTQEDLASVRATEGWHARYAPYAADPGVDGTVEIGGSKHRPGEVY
jgi:tagatose 1,6-diphosphate aldolase